MTWGVVEPAGMVGSCRQRIVDGSPSCRGVELKFARRTASIPGAIPEVGWLETWWVSVAPGARGKTA
ncbi:hypothetical protein [Corynebacterium bovis]|uniref:hypothetical protein n=1 Tax=Corynebacterium bovis TaxID=36808 RepID=UPI00313A2013